MPLSRHTRQDFRKPGGRALAIAASVLLLCNCGETWAANAPKPGSGLGLENESSDSGTGGPLSSRRIQQEVMDFSDRYVAAIWKVIDEYVATEPDPAKRVAALIWKTRFGSSSMAIAASSDPRSGLLDMTTFISIGRWSVNRYWVPEVFGEKAGALRKVYAQMDKEIWSLAGEALTPKQQSALRSLIEGWEAGNGQMHEVADVRLRNLEGVQLSDFDPENTAKGILASLRKLLSKVDTSLLYGERVMFYMQRTPRMLEQQTTLTLAQIGEAFPITTLQPDLAKLNLLVDELPLKLQEGIDHNQGLVKELLPELRSTIESGERLTKSLDSTVQALHEISARIDPTVDYTPYLRETSAALNNLNTTVTGLNQLLEKDPATGHSKVSELTSTLDQSANHLVDQLFERALILLGIFFGGLVVVLIVARLLFGQRKANG